MTEPTSSTYGSTDESPSRSANVTWLDLYDTDEDEEYEYLPLPEVDEDFLDEEVTATVGSRKECRFHALLRSCSSLAWAYSILRRVSKLPI